MKILLAITFVYGVIRLITILLNGKVFSCNTLLPLSSFFLYKVDTVFGGICNVLDTWLFYFSLIFQSWYWLFR